MRQWLKIRGQLNTKTIIGLLYKDFGESDDIQEAEVTIEQLKTFKGMVDDYKLIKEALLFHYKRIYSPAKISIVNSFFTHVLLSLFLFALII